MLKCTKPQQSFTSHEHNALPRVKLSLDFNKKENIKAVVEPPPIVHRSDLEVLSQLIDDDVGSYRIRAGRTVHYLTIAADVFDEDTMCRPYLLILKLPRISSRRMDNNESGPRG